MAKPFPQCFTSCTPKWSVVGGIVPLVAPLHNYSAKTMKLVFLLIKVLLLATATIQLDISGLREAPANKNLYVASLRKTRDGSAFCGGSLIGPTTVLTAAHCIASNPKFVAIGSHYANGAHDGEQIKVLNTVMHPKFSPATDSYDIAIIVLEQESKYPPVEVSLDEHMQTAPAVVRGWGRTAKGGTPSIILMEADVDVLTNAQCANYLKGHTIDDTMLCAGGKLGENSCQGDTGGALTVKQNGEEKLVGVASWGIGCAQAKMPGVYSRISAVSAFIKPYIATKGPLPTIAPKDAPVTTKPVVVAVSMPKSKSTPTPVASKYFNPCNRCKGCYSSTPKYYYPSTPNQFVCAACSC
ncbi:Aste57867_6245 [Aphanomyces stellatus]|uniref:Aste57867_6245 protein n=1 Tax=Aphanomyces stellatus TaxID=120398 RepID=A0A485KFL4_9STRA|nr:hypothetical protein As57867_006231 [Aphanomyces stellatus]VFT83244.1 Aste57867_6245 [Aphanomyces stellatus]